MIDHVKVGDVGPVLLDQLLDSPPRLEGIENPPDRRHPRHDLSGSASGIEVDVLHEIFGKRRALVHGMLHGKWYHGMPVPLEDGRELEEIAFRASLDEIIFINH